MTSSIGRALIWRGNRLGDVVMTIPALKLLRAHCPGCHITYVASPYSREWAEFCRLANDVLTLHSHGGLRNHLLYSNLRRRVKSGEFDLILLFGDTARYKRRIGDTAIAFCSYDFRPGHKAECLAYATMKGLGLPPGPIPDSSLPLANASMLIERAFAMLPPLSRYIVVHPLCHVERRWGMIPKSVSKAWGMERYTAVIRELIRMDPSIHVALVGVDREHPQLDAVAKTAGSQRVINLAGRTSLSDLLRLLAGAELLLAGNSGVAHLAAVTGTPSVQICTRAASGWTTPFGMGNKLTLVKPDAGWTDSVQEIPVERVLAETLNRLRSAPVSAADAPAPMLARIIAE